MLFNSKDYAPYFRDGLLYLPQKTVKLLTEYGIDPSVANTALQGLALDDDRVLIGQISQTLEDIMGDVAENSQFYRELNTEEAQFILRGRTAV